MERRISARPLHLRAKTAGQRRETRGCGGSRSGDRGPREPRPLTEGCRETLDRADGAAATAPARKRRTRHGPPLTRASLRVHRAATSASCSQLGARAARLPHSTAPTNSPAASLNVAARQRDRAGRPPPRPVLQPRPAAGERPLRARRGHGRAAGTVAAQTAGRHPTVPAGRRLDSGFGPVGRPGGAAADGPGASAAGITLARTALVIAHAALGRRPVPRLWHSRQLEFLLPQKRGGTGVRLGLHVEFPDTASSITGLVALTELQRLCGPLARAARTALGQLRRGMSQIEPRRVGHPRRWRSLGHLGAAARTGTGPVPPRRSRSPPSWRGPVSTGHTPAAASRWRDPAEGRP
jgi:hypothetical protein